MKKKGAWQIIGILWKLPGPMLGIMSEPGLRHFIGVLQGLPACYNRGYMCANT